MVDKVPPRTCRKILQALGSGTVPREGLAYIAVGRATEIDILLEDLKYIADGGSKFRLMAGEYGSGKTFLIQTIKENAVKRGYIVADVDLSPDRYLTGNTTHSYGLTTYKELMTNLSNKENQAGGALEKILDVWIGSLFVRAGEQMLQSGQCVTNMEAFVESLMMKDVGEIQKKSYGFTFCKVLQAYWRASRNFDLAQQAEEKEKVMRWFRGDYPNIREAKSALGVTEIITDENWFDIIKIWASFFVTAGYQGFLVLIDEFVNIYRISRRPARQKNYEKLLSIYNDLTQERVQHMEVILGGIPDSIYDEKNGLFSYGALKSRLAAPVYTQRLINSCNNAIITVVPLTREEVRVLLEKITELYRSIHPDLRPVSEEELDIFVQTAYLKREYISITPRTMIRDYIQILEILNRDPHETVYSILKEYSFVEDYGNS